jgi:hypothetical protein
VAAFWDNLNPQKQVDDQTVADGVYVWDDAERDRFIVEWSRLPNERDEIDDLQTFQIILYDPDVYATPTGDGIIEFQYKQITNNDYLRMYSTVGIENEAEDDGLQYTYDNIYPAAASPLSSGLVIRFTTTPPRYAPFRLDGFHADRTRDGVALSWQAADQRPLRGYRVYRRQGDGGFEAVSSVLSEPSSLGYLDRDADPAMSQTYKIGSVDPVGHETLHGPFLYDPQATEAARLSLEAGGPHPLRRPLELSFSLPRNGDVTLRLYDVTGRLVRTLVDGWTAAGAHAATWDGTDDQGHRLPSGFYLCRLRTDAGERSLKLLWVR